MSLSEVSDSRVPASSFADKALDAIPRPVMGIFGILFGLIIFLVFGGFNSSLNRVVNAYAGRIERSIESLENVTGRIAATEKRADNLEARINGIDDRLKAVESENRKYHTKEKP